MSKKLYNDLGVDENASQDEIKKAYKNKAKKAHSDKGGSDDEMALINHAYGILGQEDKRQRYDQTGQETSTPFAVKFDAYCNDVFLKIIDRSNEKHDDIIQVFYEETRNFIKRYDNEQRELQKKINKIEKVIKRLTTKEKEGRINKVLIMNINAYREQEFVLKEQIQFLNDCIDVITHYEYQIDEQENPSPSGIQFFTFNP